MKFSKLNNYVTYPRDMITCRTGIFIYKSGDTLKVSATCRKVRRHVTVSETLDMSLVASVDEAKYYIIEIALSVLAKQ